MPARWTSAAAIRHPGKVAFGLLLLVYVSTLAPSLTLWDSGEFLAAIRTLGTPHPPGTPLFVYAARVWSMLSLGSFTAMVNLGSAVATALGVVLLARVFSHAQPPALIIPASLLAGAVTAVWQSATETEVYGFALLLSSLMLVVGHRAGQRWSERDRLLLAFLCGLAVPLHLSALVTGPAAIMLSATDGVGRVSWRAALIPAAGWCVALGAGVMSPWPVVGGIVLAVVAAVLPAPGLPARPAAGVTAVLLSLLGVSFVLVMLVRAPHEPGLNEGYPATLAALRDVVARAQYDVPPVWPRRAPAWLQIGNMLQYADWQFAFGLDAQPGASWVRTPLTIAFLLLALSGVRAQRAASPRVFRAHLVFVMLASVGVVAVLNLRAGPSYGWGVLPPGALREARERDYFFAAAFAGVALWSAMGAWAWLRPRRSDRVVPMLALCTLPVVTNWRAMDRRGSIESRLPEALAIATVQEAPPGAVLLLAGDNDSYAVWWAQYVVGLRPDVTSVIVPMLPASWYREELRRRHGIEGPGLTGPWTGRSEALRSIAASSRRLGRPLAVGTGLDVADRQQLASTWRFHGLLFSEASQQDSGGSLRIDELAVARSRARVRAATDTGARSYAMSPAARYVIRLLQCPELAEQALAGNREAAQQLETACNYR